MADEILGQVPTEDQAFIEGQVPAGGQVPDASAGQEPGEAERMFPAEYVKKLREEAAKWRQRVRELEQVVRQHEEAKLSEAERLQKRLAELEREQALWQQERQQLILKYEIFEAARRMGFVDPEAVYRLVDFAFLEFDEDGRPTNLEQVLRDLANAKPYLLGTPPAGSPTNPAAGRRAGVFTASQIADRKFYQQHRDEILRALAEGRIVPD